ncbi:MAG: hypothetical protein JWN92_1962 [Candidatus Acidoferrum typicum]|jgi:hypothetical protein|nr:hypothetical protein [Candidatus Acidoferrum typicum]
MTAHSQDRVDFFLASQAIPRAILILEEEVPAHSEEQAEETRTAAVILRAAEISAPNAVEALTVIPMAGVTQAAEE